MFSGCPSVRLSVVVNIHFAWQDFSSVTGPSGIAMGGLGNSSPYFPKNQFWDSFKSDEKVGETWEGDIPSQSCPSTPLASRPLLKISGYASDLNWRNLNETRRMFVMFVNIADKMLRVMRSTITVVGVQVRMLRRWRHTLWRCGITCLW